MDAEKRLKEEALKDPDKPPLLVFFLVESFKWGILFLAIFIFGRIFHSFFTSIGEPPLDSPPQQQTAP